MDPLNTPHIGARHGMEPARTDDGTDLVIVVLDELACTGSVKVSFSGVDYAGAMPPAVAA